MIIVSIILFMYAAGAWAMLGVSGFRYWWTKDFSLDNADTALLWGAAMGPFSWFVGWLIHGVGTHRA